MKRAKNTRSDTLLNSSSTGQSISLSFSIRQPMEEKPGTKERHNENKANQN